LQGVNATCSKLEAGFVLIDTRVQKQTRHAWRKTGKRGVQARRPEAYHPDPNGDSDTPDNPAYFAKKYGANIAMHQDDAGMVSGGHGLERKEKADHMSLLFKIMSRLIKPGKNSKTFKPDLTYR